MATYEIDKDDNTDDELDEDEFITNVEYRGGLEVVETEVGFSCDECGDVFEEEEQLNGHKSVHSQ